MSVSFDSSVMRPPTSKTTVRGPVGLDGGAQAAGAAVVEIGDLHDDAAAAAAREAAVALRRREREVARPEGPDVPGVSTFCASISSMRQ